MRRHLTVFAGTWAVSWLLGGLLATTQGWRRDTSTIDLLSRLQPRAQIALLAVLVVSTLVNGFVSWRLATALTRPGQAHPRLLSALAAAGFAFGSWFLPVMMFNAGVSYQVDDSGWAYGVAARLIFGGALLVTTVCSLVALVTAAGRLRSGSDLTRVND